jgi:hypothetical protein
VDREEYEMIKSPVLSVSLFAMLTMAGALTLASQSALSAECKGMEKSACEGQNTCTWVDGYTRQDGVKVNGYCRGKGGKKSSSSSSSSG